MEEWKEVKLGDVIEVNRKNITSNYPFKEIQYLDTGSITKGKIEGYQSFKLSEAPSRAKRLLKNEDIIYSTVRPIQRHYGYISNPAENLVVSTGFTVISVNKKKANPKFLYYFLTNDETVDFLDMIAEASTSAYPSLKPSDIENLELNLPPLPTQTAIASVLSSLDDKIDLLHRQNATLEKMSETLFRQWFVEEVDEGWEEKPLSDYFDLLGGFAFKSKDYKEFGKYKVITIKGVQDGFLETNNAARLDNLPENIKSYQILKEGDILMSLTGNVGRVCLVDEENCLLNQRVVKIKSLNPEWKSFSYFYFRQKDMIEKLTYLSKGSAQLNLSPIDTLNEKETFGSNKTISHFCQKVDPMFEKLLKNQLQIRTLTHLRDTLLPKLMSGELRVSV